MDMRVFWSVLAALAVFGVLVIGWRALERERDREDAMAVMQSISDYAGSAISQTQLQERQRAWDERREQVKAEVNAEQLSTPRKSVPG